MAAMVETPWKLLITPEKMEALIMRKATHMRQLMVFVSFQLSPLELHWVTGYVRIPYGNESALMEAVTTVGPIAVALDVSDAIARHYNGAGAYDTCIQLIIIQWLLPELIERI